MLALRFACVCFCLFLAGGHSTGAQAQNDAGAVLLPPASIPQSRSRPTAPRANFGAPSPVARPVIEDQAAFDFDQSDPVLPPAPEAAPSSEPDTNSDPDITASDATSPNSPAIPNLAVPNLAVPSPATPTRNPLPPNPTPRSDLTLPASVDREESEEPSDQDDESAVVLPTADPLIEPDVDQACQQALAAAGAVFEPRGRVEGAGQCGIDDAVALQAIGDITLRPVALIACPTATTFTAFVGETITPQARQTMGSAPSVIYIAASYACRGRNNVSGARVSEHAFGRAVDVRAVDLEDGQSWHVRPHEEGSEEPEARFQSALREQACGPFNTVLGPGSDGHHSDHLHFDTARRSSSYCR